MLFLILSILCSTVMSIFMRYCEKKTSNRMVMFGMNYVICILLSRLYMGKMPLFPGTGGLRFTILAGAISGVLYLVSLAIQQWNFTTSGIIVSTTFGKLGVLVPTAMAVIFFNEKPTAIHIIGFALAIVAILIIHFDGGKGNLTEKGKELPAKLLKTALIANLFISGFTQSMSKIFDELGSADMKDHFLFYNFCFALLSTLVMLLKERQKFNGWDILSGIIIGIPNYMSSRFMLYSLSTVPATVAYPVSCVGAIALMAVCGRLLFGEKLSNKKKLAIGIIMVALALLNIK